VALRVAIAVWDERISPVFDVSRRVVLLDVENGRITNRVEERFDRDDPVAKAERLAEWKVGILICGAISGPVARLVERCGIRPIPFVSGELEEVVRAYLSSSLPNPALTMPGCMGRRRRRRMRPGGGCPRQANRL
jgi:predicted Fe-Mo cluster-binding NifX family protein